MCHFHAQFSTERCVQNLTKAGLGSRGQEEVPPVAKSDRVLSGSLYSKNSSVCAADASAAGLLCLPLHTCTPFSTVMHMQLAVLIQMKNAFQHGLGACHHSLYLPCRPILSVTMRTSNVQLAVEHQFVSSPALLLHQCHMPLVHMSNPLISTQQRLLGLA